MDRICVYGTVFNNVNTIEESIKSVFNPSYDIVIVDNYSRDGTWEKLQELRKEYNLTLLRLKSSRGKGRAYALEHCPDNSITAYFDLDTYYNENFHKAIQWTTTMLDKIVYGPFSLIAKKEIIKNEGSWRDLNVGEDTEFSIRIGFDYYIPVIATINLYRKNIDREFRYAKGIKYYKRRLRNTIDSIRGHGFNYHDIIEIYSNYGKMVTLAASIVFILAKLKGIYRYNKEVHNDILLIYNSLSKLVNPKELAIPEKFFMYPLPLMYSNMKSYTSQNLKEKLGDLLLYKCNDGYFRYVKNEEGLKLTLQQSNSPQIECIKEPL
ncbi:glycosyltransferase [Stygiolobus caldivivus]|uniref:Glycosyltransferase 2-like domain-containing protein n=1 Tax=Stygiolobus caldivivus TaxID=2824673 RepID=A0A8D5ZGG0_9CREN|nr:glycosyltransferase family A protein [Stygiolobus caldivivus]BCU68774.1 hypothetical protein KN1_00710 [Stygiolobus caldivivus]